MSEYIPEFDYALDNNRSAGSSNNEYTPEFDYVFDPKPEKRQPKVKADQYKNLPFDPDALHAGGQAFMHGMDEGFDGVNYATSKISQDSGVNVMAGLFDPRQVVANYIAGVEAPNPQDLSQEMLQQDAAFQQNPTFQEYPTQARYGRLSGNAVPTLLGLGNVGVAATAAGTVGYGALSPLLKSAATKLGIPAGLYGLAELLRSRRSNK
jgi:hypothetical protein